MRYLLIAAGLAFVITATLALIPVAYAKSGPPPLMADGKCWVSDKILFHWGDCPGGGGKKGGKKK